MSPFQYKSNHYRLTAGGTSALLYRIEGTDDGIALSWPECEIEGKRISATPEHLTINERRFLNADIEQVVLTGRFGEGQTLTLTLRLCASTPFVRFCYKISGDSAARLTKRNGEYLRYLSYPSDEKQRRTEIRLSEYDALTHAYRLREIPAFLHEDRLIGPMLAEERDDFSVLTAYEHGSMYPDCFICFKQDGEKIAVEACKGNYWDGQPLDSQPFEGVWLQFGAVKGGIDTLAKAYRTFQLSYCSLNAASRKPYIFYNTWAFQERNKFYNRQEYLSSMNQARIEQEIEIAHRMGVDVFVIDTGWFKKSGDWQTNPARFPSGMKHIHDMLEERGMKLGLWFAPCAAALSSEMLRRHPDDYQGEGDGMPEPHPVWETEESVDLCPVSGFWEDFADKLIYLAKTVGVSYFKWDAVGMDGCSRPGHLHGDESCTQADRAENFSFRIGLYLQKTVDRLCSEITDAIVDMDITEGGRYVGLGFLSAGKFFAMNNGPYYPNYDITVPEDQWINIFVNPGPARTWVCRKTLCYDRWIPSVLMMTHYLPDDPSDSQLINLASLVLGQNGIWGDLPKVSEDGVKLFGDVLACYKQVRDDVTKAYPVCYGNPGDLLEVYEKINSDTGRGLISLFANTKGIFRYRIRSCPAGVPVIFGDAQYLCEPDGLYIEVKAEKATAAILFFAE